MVCLVYLAQITHYDAKKAEVWLKVQGTGEAWTLQAIRCENYTERKPAAEEIRLEKDALTAVCVKDENVYWHLVY